MGLLRESDRTRGGHRLYDETVFDRLDAIVRMKEENRSLGFIREYFAQAEDEGHEEEPIDKMQF
jgi:DNA-binding transcriptional MerR regulator